MSEIPTRIEYFTDGRRFVWHVPFEYARDSQVAVNLINGAGIEKRLVQGSDYVLNNHAVVCVRPAGERLIVWLDAAGQESRATLSRDEIAALLAGGSESPAMAAYGGNGASGLAYNAASAPASVQPASEADVLAGLRDEAIGQINSQGKALLEDFTKKLAADFADCQARLQNAATEKQAELSRQNSSYVSLMADYVTQARESADDAQTTLAIARNAEAEAQNLNARSGNDALTAQGWANAAEKAAMDSWEAACAANQSAAQASIHARRPGISAVKCLADIHGCSPGLFIINPYLTHAPTPFMGIWPARSTDDMTWDGVFFIGACLYPDDPALPPELPPKPQPVPVGTGDAWLPCGHHELATASQCRACPNYAACAQRVG